MNLTFPVDKLVAHLESITEITDITWDKIYYWKPFKIPTDWITIIWWLISQTPNELYKRARIELRFIWNNEGVTKKSLIDLQNIVIQKLCYDDCLWEKSFDWFKVFSTIEWLQLTELLDDKKRNILVKDIIINFST